MKDAKSETELYLKSKKKNQQTLSILKGKVEPPYNELSKMEGGESHHLIQDGRWNR